MASNAGLLGCDRRTAEAEVQHQSVASGPGRATDAASSDRFDEPSFKLEMRKVGAYETGSAATVEVYLAAKAPYKVNEKYPIKLKLEPAEGVKFDSDTVGKDRVVVKGTEAVMTVGFLPEKAGTRRIAGKLKFSVCSDERCLMETRKLALAVNVK